jgi:hypothetical protein
MPLDVAQHANDREREERERRATLEVSAARPETSPALHRGKGSYSMAKRPPSACGVSFHGRHGSNGPGGHAGGGATSAPGGGGLHGDAASVISVGTVGTAASTRRSRRRPGRGVTLKVGST